MKSKGGSLDDDNEGVNSNGISSWSFRKVALVASAVVYFCYSFKFYLTITNDHVNFHKEMERLFEHVHFNNVTFGNAPTEETIKDTNNSRDSSEPRGVEHKLAGLSCEAYGGPNDEISKEMVYWEDIPSDSSYRSPFYDETKYLTFEPDRGGWNNIRMAMETMLVLSAAMGRTLVLPPKKHMYLLGQAKFSFNDFFHMADIDAEYEGLNIITMEEFLEREGMEGNLVDRSSNKVEHPPDDKVKWDGQDLYPLWKYLRRVGLRNRDWSNPRNCLAGFPKTTGESAINELRDMDAKVRAMRPEENGANLFTGNPVGSDAVAFERLRENLGGRQGLCIYDQEMQEAKLIHFKTEKTDSEDDRMLAHFYTFVYFADWKQDLWIKRFIRDHVRYVDKFFCAGARIVHAIRERASRRSDNPKGIYDSLHVRRGDFQYKRTRLSVQELFDISKPHLEAKATLYIATDEKDKSFFSLFKENYDVVYLGDFMHLIDDIPANYYGMVEQVVASLGRVFIGTWFSTLTGYINRMRGYHSVSKKMEGYENGTIKSWYFFPEDRHEEMQKYRSVRLPLYMREFPTSWRDIDKGIGEL